MAYVPASQADRTALAAILGPVALNAVADGLFEWLTGRFGETMFYLDVEEDDSGLPAARTLLTVLDAGGELSLAGGYTRPALARCRAYVKAGAGR